MEVSQTQVFPHARQHVWDKLMDFEVLGRTLPGIEKLEPIDEESCRLSVKVLVPSINGNYDGTVRVVEKQPIAVVLRQPNWVAVIAHACVVVPTVNPETITPHAESFQAVIWHLIVSHPELRAAQTKWESLR